MMKNKKIAALLGVLLAGSMAFSLSACGSTNNASDNKSSGSSSQSSDKKDNSSSSSGAGFEEVPVGPSGTAEEQDKDAGPLTVGAVYFQPIDMEPASMGLKAADSSFHLEADIHANQKGTELGYGKGDFVPELTVNYTIIDKSTGKEVEGGKATSGTFMQMNASDEPIEVTFDNWEYTPRQW